MELVRVIPCWGSVTGGQPPQVFLERFKMAMIHIGPQPPSVDSVAARTVMAGRSLCGLLVLVGANFLFYSVSPFSSVFQTNQIKMQLWMWESMQCEQQNMAQASGSQFIDELLVCEFMCLSSAFYFVSYPVCSACACTALIAQELDSGFQMDDIFFTCILIFLNQQRKFKEYVCFVSLFPEQCISGRHGQISSAFAKRVFLRCVLLDRKHVRISWQWVMII